MVNELDLPWCDQRCAYQTKGLPVIANEKFMISFVSDGNESLQCWYPLSVMGIFYWNESLQCWYPLSVMGIFYRNESLQCWYHLSVMRIFHKNAKFSFLELSWCSFALSVIKFICDNQKSCLQPLMFLILFVLSVMRNFCRNAKLYIFNF